MRLMLESSVNAPTSGYCSNRSVTVLIRARIRGGLLWRSCGDVVEDLIQVRERRQGVAQLHRLCLAQTARTCSSLANSPRAAAAFERSIAARSSAVNGIGSPSAWPPASASMARATSSWLSAGSCCTASRAFLSNSVIRRTIEHHEDVVDRAAHETLPCWPSSAETISIVHPFLRKAPCSSAGSMLDGAWPVVA